MKEDLGLLGPEIALAASVVIGLLVGSWLPKQRKWLVRALAATACLAGLAAGLGATQPATTDFSACYDIDVVTSTVRIVVLGATLLVLCLAAGPFAGHPRETESCVLLQLATLGTIVLAGAGDLLLFAGYLLASIPGYTLAAFAVVTELPAATTLDSYRGLARRRPGLAAVLLVSLLGLIGTPPTGVFIGKLEIFTATVDGGYTWLAALAVANTVASVFYYLRWLVPAFLRPPDSAPAPASAPDPQRAAGRGPAIAAYAGGVISVTLGVAAGAILPLLGGRVL